MIFFEQVPDEIMVIIFSFLEPIPDLTAIACTNKRHSRLSNHQTLSKICWDSRFQKEQISILGTKRNEFVTRGKGKNYSDAFRTLLTKYLQLVHLFAQTKLLKKENIIGL